MKKLSALLVLLFTMFNVYSQTPYELIAYTPTDAEIQYLMNLYERLKLIEQNKSDYKRLGDLYKTFEDKTDRFYSTYQRLLFESYLLNTKNTIIKNYIIDYIKNNKLDDIFSTTLIRLYASNTEPYETNDKKYIRYNYKDLQYDEGIDLFNMSEVATFNDELGLMLFSNNWNTVTIKSENINENDFSLIYGGSTNSIAVYLKRIKNVTFEIFKSSNIDGEFYKQKYSNYQIFELPKDGILSRAGADQIFMAIGNDIDPGFKEIENFSSIMFLYSEKNQTGYVVHYFMNISKNNNNYEIRKSIFNHLLFQSYLTFIY